MKIEEHTRGVGTIVMNLQALESVLRIFLLKATEQTIDFPKRGDADASINYLTSYQFLGPMIRLYNEKLSDAEKGKYSVSNDVVKIRDAFAHGRLVSLEPELPYTLWKFGPAVNSRVRVEFCETLTVDWLKQTWLMIDAEREKIVGCFKSRGYTGLR